MPKKYCKLCHRTVEDGAIFKKFARTGKFDDLCIDCRFKEIDRRAASRAGIRNDMREAGIPLRGDME